MRGVTEYANAARGATTQGATGNPNASPRATTPWCVRVANACMLVEGRVRVGNAHLGVHEYIQLQLSFNFLNRQVFTTSVLHLKISQNRASDNVM